MIAWATMQMGKLIAGNRIALFIFLCHMHRKGALQQID